MISIVTPTYNRLASLKLCVESVLSQVCSGVQLIVVDDYSRDGTQEWLLAESAANTALKPVFSNVNGGVNVARNKGVSVAENAYVLFLDSDDVLLPGALENIIQYIKNNAGRKHYMCWLAYRNSEFETITVPQQISYEAWMRGEVTGDFTHIVATDVLRSFPFFEQFRMYEQLNWYRIFKHTSPQLLLPFAAAAIDLGRSDSLTTATKERSVAAMQARFRSEAVFYNLYHEDLRRYNPAYLSSNLVKNMLLGFACNLRKESLPLVKYAVRPHVKLFGNLLRIMPPAVVRFGAVRLARIRVKH